MANILKTEKKVAVVSMLAEGSSWRLVSNQKSEGKMTTSNFKLDDYQPMLELDWTRTLVVSAGRRYFQASLDHGFDKC
jgi:hypothetical protein